MALKTDKWGKTPISGIITLLKTGSGWKINTLAAWPFRNAAILSACAACFSREAFIERDSPHAIDSIEDSSSLQVRVRRVLFCVGKKKKQKNTNESDLGGGFKYALIFIPIWGKWSKLTISYS